MIQEVVHTAKEFFHDHSNELWKGGTGFVATMGSIGISMQDFEAWLRIASLCVGITVGCITVWSIVRKDKRDRGNKP